MKRVRAGDSAINDSAPDTSPVALLIVDMLADFESADMAPMYRSALRAARKIAMLRKRLSRAGIPSIFVNDNVGRWRANGVGLIEQVSKSVRGRRIVELLGPDVDDYVLLKPKHSVFYATPLETLLAYMRARALILTGLTSTQCVLFSAMDAYVRDFKLFIPRDCVVSASRRDTQVTDYLFRTRLRADIRTSDRLRPNDLRKLHGAH
jgi:isochorismate hydrolase